MMETNKTNGVLYRYSFDLDSCEFKREELNVVVLEHFFDGKYSHTTFIKENGAFIQKKNLGRFNRSKNWMSMYSLDGNDADKFTKMVQDRIYNLANPLPTRKMVYDYRAILEVIK